MKVTTTFDISHYMEKILTNEGKKEVSKEEFDKFLENYKANFIASSSSFLPIKISVFDKEDYINFLMWRYCPTKKLEEFPNLKLGQDDVAFEIEGHYFIKYKEAQHDMHNKSISLFEKWFEVELNEYLGIPISFYLLEGRTKNPQIAVSFCSYNEELYIKKTIVASLIEIFGFVEIKSESSFGDKNLFSKLDFIYDIPEQFHKEWKDFHEQKGQVENEPRTN